VVAYGGGEDGRLRRLDDERYEQLERRIAAVEANFTAHYKEEQVMHKRIMDIIEIKESAAFGFKAFMWLAVVGGAVVSIFTFIFKR
jgi:hypothetical protein